MIPAMSKALSQLVAATGRQYRIEMKDGEYVLLMPCGGSYPPLPANAMMQRLITLTNAASGRAAIKQQPIKEPSRLA